MTTSAVEADVAAFRADYKKLVDSIGRVIVGGEQVVRGVLTSVFVGGNCLLEGVPGLGKTLLVKTLSTALDLQFSRIQFTPDLMPADIVGTNLIVEDERGRKSFQFQKGPVFSNIVLADEINRATPKTQSALLEAMQEHRVTVGGKEHKLEEPFFVLATQNPLEMEGTYPLPEAQLDRFFQKLNVPFPDKASLSEIARRTTGGKTPEAIRLIGAPEIRKYQQLVREVVVPPAVFDFVSRLVLATHPDSPYTVDHTKRFVRYGSSPRGAQALLLAAKVYALLDGRYNVAYSDVREGAHSSLRHRIIRNFEGEAEGITTDAIIDAVLAATANDPGAK